MRVALVQMNSKDEKAENLERGEMLIAQAAAWGSDLVVLPELWTYLGPRKRHAEVAEPIPGETTEFLARLAGRYGFWLVGGSFLEAVEGSERVHNTSVVLNPDGELVARYRKLHLFDVEVEGTTYQESATMAPGEEVVVASLAGVPVGLTLCYDLRFPELYRRLAAWGARLDHGARRLHHGDGPGPLGGPAAGARHREPGVRAGGRPSAARIRPATPATGTR